MFSNAHPDFKKENLIKSCVLIIAILALAFLRNFSLTPTFKYEKLVEFLIGQLVIFNFILVKKHWE